MTAARAQNKASFRPYRVTRRYSLFGKDKVTPKSQVLAELTFAPPHTKTFKILSSSSKLGDRIVRQMLEGEVDAVETYGATDLSPANYTFELVRQEEMKGRECYVLNMTPVRKDKGLLKGTIWVDAGTFMLHRLVGDPVKEPSWWLRNSHIEFSYGDVDGMWLQTSSESTANVRIFGPFSMTSSDVKYTIDERKP